MTAYSTVHIWCDHRDEANGHHCTASIEIGVTGFERAREVAAVRGWGRVAPSGDDEGDRCPEHNSAGKENANAT